MYSIFADNTLIYDSTIDDYKINKGAINLELNKSGSFSMALYPDHFFYDNFIKLKTILKVYKSNQIIFRGRVLNDDSDYWNNKTLTCEGELGFLQDSIIRPFEFTGTPEEFLTKIITEHNSQVDKAKRFKIGRVTVTGNIGVDNATYESSYKNLTDRLVKGSGGYLFITHEDNGLEEIPTIHYLKDFEKVSTQPIEFGVNLKQYTKKTTATDIATAIIPLGAELESGSADAPKVKLTISGVNNGIDYIYDQDAVNRYGWIFKVVEYSDITDANTLKTTAVNDLKNMINQNTTIELTAIDLHLLNRSIESYKLGDYIPARSEPHKFNETMLCSKQTIDLLKPENDTVTLGHTYSTFTEKTSVFSNIVSSITNVYTNLNRLNTVVNTTNKNTQEVVGNVSGDIEAMAQAIADLTERVEALEKQ